MAQKGVTPDVARAKGAPSPSRGAGPAQPAPTEAARTIPLRDVVVTYTRPGGGTLTVTGHELAALIQYGTRESAKGVTDGGLLDPTLAGLTLEGLAGLCRNLAEGEQARAQRPDAFSGLAYVLGDLAARLLAHEEADVLAGVVAIGTAATSNEAVQRRTVR